VKIYWALMGISGIDDESGEIRIQLFAVPRVPYLANAVVREIVRQIFINCGSDLNRLRREGLVFQIDGVPDIDDEAQAFRLDVADRVVDRVGIRIGRADIVRTMNELHPWIERILRIRKRIRYKRAIVQLIEQLLGVPVLLIFVVGIAPGSVL